MDTHAPKRPGTFRRRLRYSLAALLGLVALAAVMISLVIPYLRPRPAFEHGSFVMTPANRASCLSCHAAPPITPAARALALVAPEPPADSTRCPRAPSAPGLSTSRCVTCHTASPGGLAPTIP